MSSHSRCAHCGAPRPYGALDGMCPMCLLRLGLEDAAPPALPHIDGYELLCELGHGGAGVVYRARPRPSGPEVALKVIRARELATSDERRRFHAEIDAVSMLEHPGIVPIEGASEHEGLLYYTMPLYTGSLAEHMDRFRAPVAAAQLPFKGSGQVTILQAVLADPARPRAIAPDVPCDLETICLKCLEKDPERRYESAQKLAEDLKCFLDGKPIAARLANGAARLRWKMVLLAAVPVVLVAGLMALVVGREGRALADRQVAEAEQILLTAKQDELRDLMALAQGALRDLERSDRDDEATRAEALERLRGLDYGEDGYFYVYDLDGRNLMHARMPQLEGGDQWNLTDDTGAPIIQQILAKARDGGGFTQIRWPRPSQQRYAYKLTYIVPLPRWGWALGTGIYLDEVQAVTQQIRTSSAAAISAAMTLIAMVAVLAALAIAGAGLVLNVRQQRLAGPKLQKLDRQEAALARILPGLHGKVQHAVMSGARSEQ